MGCESFLWPREASFGKGFPTMGFSDHRSDRKGLALRLIGQGGIAIDGDGKAFDGGSDCH